MLARAIRTFPLLVAFPVVFPIAADAFGQRSAAAPDQNYARRAVPVASLEIFLEGPDSQALTRPAVVTLIKANGQLCREGVTRDGHVRLDGVALTEYSLRIVAPGYSTTTRKIEIKSVEAVKLTLQLALASEGLDAITVGEMAALGPQGQKALGKAIEALRMKKFNEARAALDKAYTLAPESTEVLYLFGVYERAQNNRERAKSYWMKTLELDPQYCRALLSMGEALLQENRPSDAMAYLERAVKAQPTAWRPQALYAEAYLKQGRNEEAVQHARRAQELGHGKAAVVEPILATALEKRSLDEQAALTGQDAARDRRAEAATKEQVAAKQFSADLDAGVAQLPTVSDDFAEVLPSGWMPPDIDERVGAVEPGAVCALDDVLQKAAARIQEFLENVDRFTATESLQHESFNKWGTTNSRINRKFNYVVGIQELKPGYFSVEEFRSNNNGSDEFAEGLATNGLPAMILIFHPKNAVNFEITCEGLAQRSDGRAWQLHFRQRLDRPNTIRAYRLGSQGRSYPINLKGRAWIAADTFQIVRMETQMIAPIREINLVADYTAIEYGPVHFNAKGVDMWLPQTAEAYSFWRGRRVRQSHIFSNYALFSVDDKQKISDPKARSERETGVKGGTSEENP